MKFLQLLNKMICAALVVFLLSLPVPGKGQARADSLTAVLRSSAGYPEKIKAYTALLDNLALKDFDAAVKAGAEGIALAEKNNDPNAVAELKRRTGEAWYFKGDYEKAAKLFYESVSIFEKTGNRASLAMSYNAVAKLYRKTRDLTVSLENYNKAMDIFRSLNDSAGMSMIYNESGVVFEYRGEYDRAIERYTASLQIDKRRNDLLGISYALGNIAGAYTLQKKYAAAESNLLEALAIRKTLKDSFALALNYADLGSVYFAAGNYSDAIKYLDSSNSLAEKLKYPELKANNYEQLGNITSKQGNYQLSLQYFQLRSGIRDSIFSIEKTKQVSELNTKYETAKKERTIAEQQSRIAKQTIIFSCTTGIILLVSLLGYARYRRYKLRQEIKMQAAALQQQDLAAKAVLEAEEAERRRIASDLHDGIGQTMSAARMNLSAYENRANFINEEEKMSFENIIALIDSACKEVRTVSHNMMPNALLKNSLAAAVRDFINKLDHRSLKVHLYTEGFDEALNSNTETVLYRVIQECVNNVIKHSGADTLDISLVKEKEEIYATIEDNGKGFDTTERKKADGIGMKNIRTRIEYLKGTIEFRSAPGEGTMVMLHIPVKDEA